MTLRSEERGLGPGRPVKVIRKSFSAGETVRLHYHESLEINLFTSLSGSVRIEGSVLDLAGRTCLVLAPRRLHAYRILPSGGTMTVVHIALSGLKPLVDGDLLARMLARLPPSSPAYSGIEDKVAALLERLPGNEAPPDGDAAARTECAAAILGFCAFLLAAGGYPAAGDSELRALIDWTEARLDASPTLAEAARATGRSRSSFCHWFAERTGSSYHAYVEELRLEAAWEGLVAGKSLAEAAQDAGYKDTSYFVRRFRLRFGTTPMKRLREECPR